MVKRAYSISLFLFLVYFLPFSSPADLSSRVYEMVLTHGLHRVIQRWQWLLLHTAMSNAAAYDMARKELYRFRHQKEVEARVAREESLAVGAYFGLGPLEVGEHLEDKAYENWKEWAVKETLAIRALGDSSYTGTEDGAELAVNEPNSVGVAGLQELAANVPGSQAGQTAQGGAAVTV